MTKTKTVVHIGTPFKSQAVLVISETEEGAVFNTYGTGTAKVCVDAVIEGLQEMMRGDPERYKFKR